MGHATVLFCCSLHSSNLYIRTTSISNDKQRRNDSDLDMVTFHFMDGDIARSTSDGVYISLQIRFVKVCSHVIDLFIIINA